MKRSPFLIRVACVVMAFAWAGQAFAQVYSPTNFFPDPFGYYKSLNTVFYPTGFGLVTLEGLTLSSPAGSIPPPAAPGAAVWGPAPIDGFALMSFFGGPTVSTGVQPNSAAASITGLLDAPPLHTYTTEMLSLDLTGLPVPPGPFGPVLIRESPTLVSTGGHTVEDAPPGFRITSFFDVFTELSLDGGASWTPAVGAPMHIENPEPTGLALLALAAPLICRRARRA